MSASVMTIRDMPKRRPRPPAKPGDKKKPNRSGRPIMVWVDTDVGEALDRFIDGQRMPPTLTDVVELALREFLKAEGFAPKAKP